MKTPLYFDNRWNGRHGIGRFSSELEARLPGLRPLRIAGPKLSPYDPLAISLALAGLRDGLYLSPGFNPPLRSPIPFAFTIHDLTHLKVAGESTPVRRLYYAAVVRPAAHRAMCVLTGSQFSREEVLEWSGLPPDRVRVVGNGVSAAFHAGVQPAPAQTPYLLHVGRRGANKNIARLLQAFALGRARTDFEFCFTGDADAATLEQARNCGVLDRIRFAGPLSDDELAQLYAGARALVFPSIWEGFGLPVVEAMACGTPVVTADASSTREIAGDGAALLVDPLDVAALADAIDRVASDDALAAALRERGAVRAAQFSWNAVATRVCEALA